MIYISFVRSYLWLPWYASRRQTVALLTVSPNDDKHSFCYLFFVFTWLGNTKLNSFICLSLKQPQTVTCSLSNLSFKLHIAMPSIQDAARYTVPAISSAYILLVCPSDHHMSWRN